jgi:3-hydroxybutyrate dehydrogenase
MEHSKIALITGSTSGIGLAIAKNLASEGCRVIINGFADDNLIRDIKSELKAHYDCDAYYYGADLTNVSEIENMMSTIEKDVGSIDILVNNAGMQFVSPIEEFPIKKWDDIISLDLSAVFHTSRLVIPAMREKKWGRIINIASAHALVASPFKSAYVAAKHGVAGLTKAIALEVAENGITVNSICPGYVHTALVDAQIDNTAKARGISREAVIKDVMLGNQATKAFVSTSEVAGFVSFLISPCANSITGAILSIDGGWTAH